MAQLINQDDFLKTALRIPRDLHEQIQSAAKATGRSMNAEIVARLQNTFEAQSGDSALRLQVEENTAALRRLEALMEGLLQAVQLPKSPAG